MTQENAGLPVIVAHRGASAAETENTIVAFDKALADGADAVELDIRWTADGIAVVYHDPSLLRNGRKVAVRKLAAADFIALKSRESISVPTFTEALGWARNKTPLVFDIKDTGREEQFIAEVERVGFHPQSVFSSFRLTLIGKIKARRPDWQTAWIVGNSGWSGFRRVLIGPIITRAVRWGADALHFHHSWVTPKLVQRCRREKLKVAVWTVDKPEEIRKFIELGVDAIITNVPDVVRHTLDNQRPAATQ